jgi:hypothetical protein
LSFGRRSGPSFPGPDARKVSRRDGLLPRSNRRPAVRAQIVIENAVRKEEKQFLPHGEGLPAFRAEEAAWNR